MQLAIGATLPCIMASSQDVRHQISDVYSHGKEKLLTSIGRLGVTG